MEDDFFATKSYEGYTEYKNGDDPYRPTKASLLGPVIFAVILGVAAITLLAG